MTAIKFGMDSAPEICVERVRSMRRELKLVVERLNTYLQLHFMVLTPFEKKVRNLLVEAVNHGMDEGFHELAVQADELQGNHQDGAPIPGTGTSCKYPSSGALETAGVGRHVKFGRTGPRLEGSSARTVGRRRKTQDREAFRGSEGEGAEDQEHERGRFPPVMGVQGGVVW